MGCWNGPSQSGCAFFQLWGCPASAVAVAGIWDRVWRACSFFGTVFLSLFKTLLFPSYATRCRYDVPGVLASGSGLAASACSCACGRCLRIALGPGAGFPFVSSLWEGRSDGSVPGDRFLSLGWMCLIHSVPVEFSRFCAVCRRVGFSSSSGSVGVTVGSSGAVPRGNFWGSHEDWVFQFSPWFEFWLTSSLSFPGCSHPELVVAPSLEFDFTGLVVWLLLAPRSWEPPSQSSPFSHSVTFWRLCGASWGPPLFSRLLRRTLAYGLTVWPLPHSRWSRVHGRASAGLIRWASALGVLASWLAQWCIPLLRPFALLLAFWGGVPSGSLLRFSRQVFVMGLPFWVEPASVLDRNEDSSSTFLVFGWGLPILLRDGC